MNIQYLLKIPVDIIERRKSQYIFVKTDIVVKNKEGNTIIMDTKWKRLYDSPQENYGISQVICIKCMHIRKI